MPYIITTATKKLIQLKKRIKGIAGGTAAGKTISIIQILIDKAQRDKKPTLTSITSESMPHLKRGAIRDFLNIMGEHNYFNPDLWNKTDYTYTFETGSKIEFFSLDMPHKVRGPRRQRLFINEANNIPLETFDQLEVRTTDEIWLDWNPTNEFWWYTDVSKRDDTDFMILTYKDNEGLDESIVKSIEMRKNNKNWWLVYGLGQLGEVEGKIYKDWQIIDSIPHEARLERYGLDFGYSNDPTAIVAVYKYNEGFIIDEIAFQKGLMNNQISDILKNQVNAVCIADSAEPKSIDEILSYGGLTVLPSLKGPGSVNKGIDWVQQQRISVTQRSLNVIKEYRNYMWKTDKDGKIINEPDVGWDHCFVGNTKILTKSGLKRIDKIKVGEYVWSPFGWNKVYRAGSVGKQVVKDYGIFKCTLDHKILTSRGLVEVDKLRYDDIIMLWKSAKQFNLMELLIGVIQMPKIELIGFIFNALLQKGLTARRDFYTEMFGNTIMAKFLLGIWCIISTIILPIMILPILPLSFLVNMLKNIIGVFGKVARNILIKLDHFLLNGIGVKKAGNIQKKLQKNNGKQKNGLLNNVLFAVKNIKPPSLVEANTVIKIAKQKHLEKEEVYNLSTKFGCYFANGILVSNSMDAIRYAINDLRPKDYNLPVYDVKKWKW